MSKGYSGLFDGTSGSKKKVPLIKDGHVTLESIAEHREFFLGKSVKKIDKFLHNQGYETTIRPSKHATSRAKIIVTTNPSSERNIAQVQVSPGSKRHGDIPYVKISTKDIGIIKIIDGTEEKYKTDGKEKAHLLFRRYGSK